jgi:hypothetical protein
MPLRGRLTTSWLLPALLLLAAAALRCSSASSTVAGPTSNLRCGVTVTPQTTSVGAAGGSGTLTLTTDRECQWAIVLTSNWLSITSSMSGQGPSSISYSAAPNSSASPRTAEVAVGDQRVSISQQACAVAVSPASLTIGPAGGAAKTAIATDDSCSWSVDSAPDWIAPALSSGKGSADLTLLASANQGAQRTGTVVIAGQSVTITQAASPTVPAGTCSFTLAPLTFPNVPASGTSLDVTISTQAGCAWTAATGAPWMSVANGASGTGNGTTRLSVAQNSGDARSGAATVAGRTVTVSQLGAASTCTYSISSTSFNPGAGSESTQVTVTTTSGCAWSVTGLQGWISANPASGTGAGNVTLTVQANGGGQRSADLTIAGQTFHVTQAAAVGCSYSLDPTSLNVTAAGTGTTPAVVHIATTSGCAWSVTIPSGSGWITANPASGNGPHDVSLSIPANTGGPRNADLTIAGQTFHVTQSEPGCNYGLTPAGLTDVAATGASRTVTISTTPGCAWSVTIPPDASAWISANPASGSGPHDVSLTVQANDGFQRSADLTIAGHTFTVTQAAVACNYTLDPTSLTDVAATGASQSVTITAPPVCNWNVNIPPNASGWISANPASGTGSGSTTLTIQANLGGQRSADLTIAGQHFTVTQVAVDCNYGLNPMGLPNVPAAGIGPPGTEIHITAPSGFCGWSVSGLPGSGWIGANPASGNGTGSTFLTVQANGSGAPRGVDISIAGHSFTVHQLSCNYVLNPTGLTDVPAAGASRSVMVTTTPSSGCSWNVTDLPFWITATPASGNGTASTLLTILANSGGARSWDLMIAGQRFTVSQAAFTCSYQLSPTGLTNVAAAGDSQSVGITTTPPSGCAWSVTGLPPPPTNWISASPLGGTGSGSTQLTMAANPGGARNATITIAGQPFTVGQCGYVLSPTSLPSVPFGGATQVVNITMNAGCAWSVTIPPSAMTWIGAAPTSGTGPGSTTLTIQANAVTSPRDAILTIAGQSFPVHQLAHP